MTTCQSKDNYSNPKFSLNIINPDNIPLKSKEQNDNNKNQISKLINNYQEYKDKYIHNSNKIKEEVIYIYKNAIQIIEQAFEIIEKIDKII